MTKRVSNCMTELEPNLSTIGLQVMTDDDVFDKVNDKEMIGSKEISDTDLHNKDISNMLFNEDYCDCILRIDGHNIPVNRSILASRCHHFRALFFGQMKESKQNVIELPDIKLEPFRHILHYIYSGKLFLSAFTFETVLEILQLSQYYCFERLVEHIVYYLKISLSMANVWQIQRAAKQFSIVDLIRASNLFIDKNAEQVLENQSFIGLESNELKEMLERDSFYIENEEKILKSVCIWLNHNWNSINPKVIEDVLSSVRLKEIESKKRFKTIIENSCLDYPLFSNIYETLCKGKLKHEVKSRGSLILNQNLASNRFDVKVVKGRRRSKMINDCNRWYTRGANCTCHSIGTSGETQIVIALSKIFIVNHIVLVLFDIGKYAFNYTIEVSVDRKNWIRIIDHSNYLCRSFQYLFFEPKTVKYIRIIGNKSVLINDGSKYQEFEVLHFECMFCTIPIEIDRTFVVPKVSVFKTDFKESPNAERKYLDISSGYPKKMTTDGKIVKNNLIPFERGSICWFSANCVNFQLSQPFLIDSIAFKFKFLENSLRTNPFTYYVEISNNYEEWHIIQDIKQIESCGQKEVIQFTKQPVVFIRIASPTTILPSNMESFECPLNNQISIDYCIHKRRKS